MVFAIALDGTATFAGLNTLGMYKNQLVVSLFEAQPFMAQLIASWGILAILTGIAWIFTAAYLYQKVLKGFWKEAFWAFIILSHGAGAISWILPKEINHSIWALLGNSWSNLLLVEIVAALLLASRVKGVEKKIF